MSLGLSIFFGILFLFCLLHSSAKPVSGGTGSKEGSGQHGAGSQSTGIDSARKLYVVPNHAGLFSYLLQVKAYYQFAQQFGRSLVWLNATSTHYEKPIDICTFYNFSGVSVVCGSRPENVECHSDLSSERLSSAEAGVCYKGNYEPMLNGEETVQESVVAAVTGTVPFRIADGRLALLKDFKRDLGLTTDRKLVVAHWRRGDQQSRCDKHLDTSVNCRGAGHFVKKVRDATAINSRTIVYVATNEPADSKELVTLASAGFKTLKTVGDASAQSLYSSLDVVTVLALESQLMLEADTFLAFGFSEIDDVIEHERRLRGKTHCLGHVPYATPLNVTYCFNLMDRERLSKQKGSGWEGKGAKGHRGRRGLR